MFTNSSILCVILLIIVNSFETNDAIIWSLKKPSNRAPDLEQVLKSNGIVPQIIDQAPKDEIKIAYSNGNRVNRGNQLTVDEVVNQPAVEWPAQDNSTYTIALVDPDAPSRQTPTMAQWRHWLVVDIPGSDIGRGRILTPYEGSDPPSGTGLHRYIFVVYKENNPFASNFTIPDERSKFDIRKFANDNNLGQPVAINFFEAKAQNYSK